ncbi:lantibiotic dehydratase [Sphingobacterium anhuiense]|uniref:lantibiotic dehydratase n=1 Tax=Sphingobacterium anhuiense TaxID=493780 RepID=UPI003C2BE5AE
MYKDLGKVVIRKPLYNYSTLFSLDGETKSLEDLVIQKLDDPVFLEAIYWTSQDLYTLIQRFKKDELLKEKRDRLFITLQKYIIRASTRCTPYGIFAGCSISNIRTDNSDFDYKIFRRARIDMGLLYELIQVILEEDCILEYLSYQLNNSIYQSGKSYRYVETVYKEGKVEYQTASVERSELLDILLQQVKEKKLIESDDIFQIIGNDIAEEDRKMFFRELIESQLLLSELFVALTDPFPLDRLKKILLRIVPHTSLKIHQYLDVIIKLVKTLNCINQSDLGELPINLIEDCCSELKTLGIEVKQEHLFHIDLWNPHKQADQFPQYFLKDIQQATEVLARLTATSSLHEAQLKKFRQLFSEKYGDREIPLLEAIDMEKGIGFPAQSKLGNVSYNEICDLISSSSKNRVLPTERHSMAIENWLQKKVREANEQGAIEIDITKADVSQFENQMDKMAPEISVMGTLLPAGKVLLENLGGSNNLSLLGRFAYIDEKLSSLCRSETSRLEKETDVIYAEIVHLTEGRVANISRKTGLFSHQILYLAYSDPKDTTVSIMDLLLSVQHDELILRCRKTSKRVIPVLTNAHNFLRSNIPVYHFLASLQHQGRPGLGIHWGSWSNFHRFLPRIRTGNVVLQRAKWQIMQEDIHLIFKSPNPNNTLAKYIEKWCIPRFVSIQDGDNELFLDIEKPDYLNLLLQELKRKNKLILVEWLFESPSSGAREQFIRQFVLPLQKENVRFRDIISSLSEDIPQSFAPGSEWIYFKLYCGASISDELLLYVVKPAIAFLLKEKIIDKAFFIHYTDPHYHLRVRMHFTEKDSIFHFSEAMALVQKYAKAYLEDGRIWKLQLDTYQREVGRYGVLYMENTEEAFFYDTMTFLDFLQEDRFQDDHQYRFALGLNNIDNWLSLFSKSLEEKMIFCSAMANAFAHEYDKETGYQVDQFYRGSMGENINMLNESIQSTLLFDQRAVKLRRLKLPQENLASYIHMSMNRWFSVDQRLMEYVSYRFMEKQYKKILFQEKNEI